MTDKDSLDRFSKDAVYAGHPDYAHVAGDLKTTIEVIQHCYAKKIPITFCGSQTSMTGASVPMGGLALSLVNKNKIIDISTDKQGNPFVITEPGVVLGDLKKAVKEQGFFYPPDPTSCDEAVVGATIATNATGDDTYKYGPTRPYVLELDVVLPDGSQKILKRTKPVPESVVKNTAGYYLDGEEIDQVIGSEGTLCLIHRLKLKLIKNTQNNIFILILPFSSFEKCMQAVAPITTYQPKPSALEFVGPGAIEIFQSCPACPTELKTEKCFLYIKGEYSDPADLQTSLEGWFNFLTSVYTEIDDLSGLDRIFLAQTDQQLSQIKECRHHIPLWVNEEYFPYADQGAGKVGTDWWVPVDKIYPMMMETYKEAQALSFPFITYAHIGNGHPHWNFLTKTPEQKKQALDFVKRQCHQVVQYGGGVAGEHGIGKIKHYLMDIQHAPGVIEKMRALKNRWDPYWLFGRGNILEWR